MSKFQIVSYWIQRKIQHYLYAYYKILFLIIKHNILDLFFTVFTILSFIEI